MEYFNYTGKEYRQAIESSTLYPVIKVELLDQYENAYTEISEEIIDTGGSISSTLQQGVRNTVQFSIFDPLGTFIPNANNKLFWIRRKFKLYSGLATEQQAVQVNGKTQGIVGDIFWFSKGVYIITDISAQKDSSGNQIVSFTGVDKFGAFTNDTGYGEMVGTFSFDAGMTISYIIKNVLKQDIGNGEMLDPIEPIIDPSLQDYQLELSFSKGPGSYIGDLLNDLATTFHADIYYDMDGHLNVKKALNFDEYKNVQNQWDFRYGEAEYISSQVNYQLKNVANYIYVIGDNPMGGEIPVATAENNDPRSPLSIQKIGRKTRYFEKSTVYSYQEALDYANYILKQSCLLGNAITFNCSLIPHLELDNTFSLTDPFYNYNREEFIITAITYPLGSGNMQITGSNIKELPET